MTAGQNIRCNKPDLGAFKEQVISDLIVSFYSTPSVLETVVSVKPLRQVRDVAAFMYTGIIGAVHQE